MFTIGQASELRVSIKELANFYKLFWKRRGISLSISDFYKWQFKENNNFDYSLVVLDKNKLIGTLSLVKHKFIHLGEIYKGAQIIAQLVHPDYRNQGIGTLLLKKAQNDYDFIVSMGITDSALPLYYKLNFTYKKFIPRLVKINQNIPLPSWVKANRLGKFLIKKKHINKTPEIIIKQIKNTFEFKFIERILFIHKKENSTFLVDAKYLDWRFLNHPIFEYKIYYLKKPEKNNEDLLIVTRLHECENKTKIMHIIDVFGSQKNFYLLNSFLERELKDKSINVFDFYNTNESIIDKLKLEGWFSVIDEDFIYCPNLFFPLEETYPPTTSIAIYSKIKKGKNAPNSFLDTYISKKDCSLDLPTKHTFDILFDGCKD